MYHFANEILTTVGIEESMILVAGAMGLFAAFVIRWAAGASGWLTFAATSLPLVVTLYLAISCWQVNWETVHLLQRTNAIAEPQAALILDGMYSDIVSITTMGSLLTLLLWGGLRFLFRRVDRTADEAVGQRDELERST